MWVIILLLVFTAGYCAGYISTVSAVRKKIESPEFEQEINKILEEYLAND